MNLHFFFFFFFVIKELQTCNNNRIWLHLCNISLDREMQTLRFFTDRFLLFYLISEACIMHCALSLLKGMSGSCLILLIIVGFFPDNIYPISITWAECIFSHCLSQTFVRVYFYTQHAHCSLEGFFKLLCINITDAFVVYIFFLVRFCSVSYFLISAVFLHFS